MPEQIIADRRHIIIIIHHLVCCSLVLLYLIYIECVMPLTPDKSVDSVEFL